MGKLKRTKLDMSGERKVLTQMIVSTELLSRLQGIAEARLFESNFARIVATWVWDYWKITSAAPEAGMEDIFQRNSPGLEEEDREMVADFLGSLSEEWERAKPTNTDYAFDTALHYFKIQSIKQMVDKLQGAVTDDNPALAEKLIGDYTRPEKPEGEAVDMFRSHSEIQRAFTDEDEELFQYPGALGVIVGPIIREDFIAFLAPPKRGKSWWLMYSAIRASLCGLRVLFVNLEMSQNQLVRRFWQSLQGASKKGQRSIMTEFVQDGDKFILESFEETTRKVDATSHAIEKLQRQIRMNTRGGDLRLETFPTKSVSVGDIRTRLDNLETYDDFIPDVICIDYADIMAHGGQGDERHRINDTWERLRGLAQERHAAIFTASQAGRKTVTGRKDAAADDIAEDIRKLGHVTKLITINQTPDEKKRGVSRLGAQIQREGGGREDTAVVLSCLDIGRPYMDSKFEGQVDFLDGDQDD